MKRFELVFEFNQEVIRDVQHGLNLFFLASTGFGTTASTIGLAQRVVDYLNSLPPNETLLYPFNQT